MSSTPSSRRLRKARIDREPPLNRARPAGPFEPSGKGRAADLLLFVPRNRKSRFIDQLTGRYGYSHAAVDCGEVDSPTGRRVWIEATMEDVVHYAFQDEYGDRPFVRIPLSQVGVDADPFCACVKTMLGEAFDDPEALTLGILDNPARQVCSDLVTHCLPDSLRAQILICHRAGLMHPLSAVPHARADERLRLFVSPNGFAEYLGAPRGGTLSRPDCAVTPHPLDSRRMAHPLRRVAQGGDALVLRAWDLVTRL